MTRVTRTRPRKPRNPYRDPIWCRAVLRCWSRNQTTQADLDRMFSDALKEPTMQNTLEIEITVKGRDRVHCLPRICPGNTEPAAARLDWLRRTSACDQVVLQEAERIITAIAKASA